jgi:hypothetical protein
MNPVVHINTEKDRQHQELLRELGEAFDRIAKIKGLAFGLVYVHGDCKTTSSVWHTEGETSHHLVAAVADLQYRMLEYRNRPTEEEE